MEIKDLNGVSKERILKEFSGMLASPHFVDKGLPLMLNLGIDKCIPGLHEMFEDFKTCNQNPKWHAEGGVFNLAYLPKNVSPAMDVSPGAAFGISGEELVEKYVSNKSFTDANTFTITTVKCGTAYEHTIHVMEEMAKQIFKEDGSSDFDEHDRFILMLAAMLHDIGKPASARKNGKKNPEDDWGKTKDHDVVGEPLAIDFCKNLGMSNDDVAVIAWLVKHHMRFHQIWETKSKCKRWRMISNPLFDFGVMLARADERGCRKTADDEWRGIDKSLEHPDIKDLIGKPMPDRILTGDYIISKGFKPGPTFKKALDKAYEFQIDNGITDIEELFKKVKGIVKGV